MKATTEEANRIVSKWYDSIGKSIKVKKTEISRLQLFEATEMIAKGYSIIEVRASHELNKDQKEELIKIIKEI